MTTSTWLPPSEYYASLPKCLAGAALLLHDAAGRLLIVKPRYRNDTWEIPGGALEPSEHPWQTAKREAAEELGIDVSPGALLAVDWVPAQPDGRPPLANYVFDGGVITEEWAREHVRLDTNEVIEWRLADAADREALLIPLLARRLTACLAALADGGAAYLHDGRETTGV